MQARTTTPAELFGADLRYVVPIFQRPYVWTRTDQWEPLWQDVRLLADQASLAPHFLGAIVLDAPSGATRYVVDGQQRLVTLQLLIHAAATVARRCGRVQDADKLQALGVRPGRSGDRAFTVWPGRGDRTDYRAAMTGADTRVAGRVVLAHSYFTSAITEWASGGGSRDELGRRLGALATALTQHLRLVVIDLEAGDNAQVVFESLNHRGVPLLAADLIKNMIFQLASSQGLQVEPLYERHWQQLDAADWRHRPADEKARPRIDTFIRRWLVVRLLHDVPADHIVASFRRYLAAHGDQVDHVLADLAADARVYAKLDREPLGSEVDRFRYRVLDVLDLESFGPVLLLLMRWRAEGLPPEQFSRALAAVESWAVRRGLARIKNSNTMQIVVRLIRHLQAGDRARAGELTEAFLAGLKGQDTWPDDQAVRRELTALRPSRVLPGKRTRMLLEAIEDRLRAERGRRRPCSRDLTVEHIMPVKWAAHWPGAADVGRRNRFIALIGNHTLVSLEQQRALANLPWTDAAAAKARPGRQGKRAQLARTSLVINEVLVADNKAEWSEASIEARTHALADLALRIWSGPPGASEPVAFEFEVMAPAPADAKYTELTRFLRRKRQARVEVALAEIEDVLGFALPDEARTDPARWAGDATGYASAVTAGGYELSEAHLDDGYLTLTKRAKDGAPMPVAGVARPQRSRRRRSP